MKIGVIGIGIVGEANSYGFKKIGNKVFEHDIKLKTKVDDLKNCEVIFLCLPTPSKSNGDCDTSIIEKVIKDLNAIKFHNGIVCIRSTVTPGFTSRLIKKFQKMKICYSPEFLRERKAKYDFIKNHQLLAVGTNKKEIFNKVCKAHKSLPKNKVMLSPKEAELLKYFNNIFASLRVVFANIMFELTNKLNCNYDKVKDAYIKTGKALDIYLNVSKNLRGYGGPCLPKDTKALRNILKNNDLNFKLIQSIEDDNNKFKTTVFKGMRKN